MFGVRLDYLFRLFPVLAKNCPDTGDFKLGPAAAVNLGVWIQRGDMYLGDASIDDIVTAIEIIERGARAIGLPVAAGAGPNAARSAAREA